MYDKAETGNVQGAQKSSPLVPHRITIRSLVHEIPAYSSDYCFDKNQSFHPFQNLSPSGFSCTLVINEWMGVRSSLLIDAYRSALLLSLDRKWFFMEDWLCLLSSSQSVALSFPYEPVHASSPTEDRSHFPAYQTSVAPSTLPTGDRAFPLIIRPARLPAFSTPVVLSYLEDLHRAFLRMNSGSRSLFERIQYWVHLPPGPRTPVLSSLSFTYLAPSSLLFTSRNFPLKRLPIAPSSPSFRSRSFRSTVSQLCIP